MTNSSTNVIQYRNPLTSTWVDYDIMLPGENRDARLAEAKDYAEAPVRIIHRVIDERLIKRG